MSYKPGEDSLSAVLEDPAEDARDLQLLLDHEPRHRTFLGDLGYVLGRKPPLPPIDDDFWHDVFVPSRLPWTTFVESLVYHALVLVALLAWGQWAPVRHIKQEDPFKNTRVIVYPGAPKPEVSTLPKLDTGSAGPHRAQAGDPTYARQPILSVPREPDNRAQTIITPPDIVLRRDVRIPNIVAWAALPVAPTPSVPVLASERSVLAPDLSVIAPPPQVDMAHRNGLTLPQAAPVAPPPDVRADSTRNQPTLATEVVPPPPQVETSARMPGAINMGRAEVIAPSPQLPVNEQRTLRQTANGRAGQAISAGAVPPSPSVSSTGTTTTGRMIALSVNPVAPAEPVSPPAGNRRGEFSATPQGSPQGSGRPTILASTIPESTPSANNTSTGNTPTVSGLPPGIHIGEAPPAWDGNNGLQSMASITIDRHPIAATIVAPRVTAANRKPATLSERTPSESERKVFGPRRFYQMTLNMPNLNSAGGSWIVRFAELNAGPNKGELFSPLITLKSDPAYPSELQRANVQGTVTLYAIIHSDGSVRDIRVLNGADDRLDQYAREALARCRFEPAIKDGTPVALEAVVSIPFRARKEF